MGRRHWYIIYLGGAGRWIIRRVSVVVPCDY